MWVSGREAGRLLRGVLASDEQARLLLRTGIAGPGLRTRSSVLYEDSAIRELARRQPVDADEVRRLCPRGVFVARLPRGAELDLSLTRPAVVERVLATMAGQRRLSIWTAAFTALEIRFSGPLPFAATYFGFVVLTAELTDLRAVGPTLAPPGPWSVAVTGRRLRTPTGGRPAFLWTPHPT